MKRPDRRPRRAPIKRGLEPLEMQQLMSAGGKGAQGAKLAEVMDGIGHSQAALESFARGLALSPARASSLGLAALATELRSHAAYARQHGWAASLPRELATHPRYGDAHHLSRLIFTATTTTAGAPPSSPTGTNDPSSSSSATAPPDGSTTTSPSVPNQPQPVTPAQLTPTSPIAQSGSVVGKSFDVNLASGAGLSGSAYIITPQPFTPMEPRSVVPRTRP